MITNKIITERIKQYTKAMENHYLNTYPNELLVLLKEDILNLEKKDPTISKDSIFKATKEELFKFKFERSYIEIGNAFKYVFIDYYFNYIEEKLEKNTFYDFSFLLKTIFFTISTNSNHRLKIMNLLSLKISGQIPDIKYLLKYHELLGNKELYENVETIHEELYRQFSCFLIKFLIKNKLNDLIIEFYLANKNYISEKYVLECLYQNTDISIDDEFYNFNFIKFVENLFNKMDNLQQGLAKFFNKYTPNTENNEYIDLFNETIDENSSLIQDIDLLHKNLLDIFELLKNNIQFRDEFMNYYRQSSYDLGKKVLNKFIDSCFSTNYLIELTRMIFDYKNNYCEISINCLYFLEQFLDFLIDLEQNNNYLIFNYEEDLLKLISFVLSVYLKAKELTNYIINDEKYFKYRDEILRKFQKLEEQEMMKNLYLAERLQRNDKIEILRDFFNSSFATFKEMENIITCKDIYSFKNYTYTDVNKCINAIINNERLTNQIVSGEILIKPLLGFEENITFLKGDYTSFLTCQIKSIERYIKEILFKYYKNDIYDTKKFIKNRQQNRPLRDFRLNISSTEDLNLECGPAYFSLKFARKIVDNDDNLSLDFINYWIKKVRNGHFHFHTIETIDELKILRIKTAYWFMYLITSLKNKGIL